MMTRIRLALDALRTSLWFVPSVLVLAAVVLAYALLGLDAALPGEWWRTVPWLDQLLDVRLGGASAMLQVIGGSVITVVGVVFSITIAALTLASGQYTSRVLRNFIRDRANQTVLGSLLGIFVYCLLVMRSLSGASESSHAPPLALLMALALAFVGVGLLIFFIHHIALGLQATSVVASIAREALPSIDRHFPARDDHDRQPDTVGLKRPEGGTRYPVFARGSGYVTGIDLGTLVEVARDSDGLVRVRRGAGLFIAEGEVVAELQCAGEVDSEPLRRIAGAWSLATQRTLENDPGFGIRQLVDVALKALSPGVNETTTGVMCVNWLGVMLLRMAGRRFPQRLVIDDERLRVITGAKGFGDFLAAAFDQIRQCAAGNVAILMRQLEVLESLALSDAGRSYRQPLLRQVEAIAALVEGSIPWEPDREPLRERIAEVRGRLGD